MGLYAGFDLHSTNNHLGIIDHKDKRIFKKKLPNEPEVILETLKPYRKDIVGAVIESTFKT